MTARYPIPVRSSFKEGTSSRVVVSSSDTAPDEYSVEFIADDDSELSLESVPPEEAVSEVEAAFEDLT